jgi:hypothetical protein
MRVSEAGTGTPAKQAARRVRTTVEWLAEGKARNWKYEKRSSR